MSFKIDTLLKKAVTFEKLALYGNRRDFLVAIAQSPAEVVSAYDTLDGFVRQLNSAIENFINTSADPQSDLPGNQRGLPPSLVGFYQVIRSLSQSGTDADTARQAVNAARQLVNARNLGNMSGNARQAWSQMVAPVVYSVVESAAKIPAPQPLPEVSETPTAAPAAPAAPQLRINPANLLKIQKYLNQDMVLNRKLAVPIQEDGKWGEETRGMLLRWGRANNLTLNLQNLLDVALARATGAETAAGITTGPGYEATRRTP